ncbi:MAG: TVP38/TMEM64 family protein [Pedosphaera parvula]|nr:TVP38/TMEM64 family protein [Pedosphaera parvula]
MLIGLGKYFDAPNKLEEVVQWIDGLGYLGPLVFVLLYITSCILLLPGSVLTLGAGLVFGLVKGFLCVSIGSTIGATLCFLIGRYLARDWVARKIERNEKFKAVDQAIAQEGWKIVGLLRLSPVFPFNVLNYSLGLTRVSLRDYVLASWIGMMPGTMMYVYFGTLGRGIPRDNPLLIVGLIATVLATVLITRSAQRALARRVRGDQERPRSKTAGDGVWECGSSEQ